MIRVFLVFLFLINSACSDKISESPSFELSAEPTFMLYIKRFIDYSLKYSTPVSTNNLIVRIDNSMIGPNENGDPWILAYCVKRIGGYSEVLVNPYFWNNKNYLPSDREELIFHELGHCLLNRPHESRTILAMDLNMKVPISIMNSFHLGRVLFEGNYEYYIKELFFQKVNPNIFAATTSSFDASYYKELNLVKTKALAQGHYNEDKFFVIDGISCGDE